MNGGTLTLSGTSNNYSGATTVNTGARWLGCGERLQRQQRSHLKGTGTLDLGSVQQTIKSLNSTAGTAWSATTAAGLALAYW